jgi:hypothetical protein
MTADDEQARSATPSPAAKPVHHRSLSEEPRLPDLPEEDEKKVEDDETFRPGPSFGTGM